MTSCAANALCSLWRLFRFQFPHKHIQACTQIRSYWCAHWLNCIDASGNKLNILENSMDGYFFILQAIGNVSVYVCVHWICQFDLAKSAFSLWYDTYKSVYIVRPNWAEKTAAAATTAAAVAVAELCTENSDIYIYCTFDTSTGLNDTQPTKSYYYYTLFVGIAVGKSSR